MVICLPVIGKIDFPVLISSICFAVNHIQYHKFRITPLAIRQILIAFIGGVFLGNMVEYTNSILSALTLHISFNSVASIYALWRHSAGHGISTVG